MSTRQIRRFCYLAATALLLGVGGWAAHQLRQGVERPDWNPPALGPTSAAQSQRGPSEPTLSDFAPLWNKRLRRPLVDPIVERPANAVAGPPINVALLGTIVEPGRSAALLSSGGKIELKQVGDSVGGAARLQEVHPDRAVLQIHDRRVEIRLPEPKDRP